MQIADENDLEFLDLKLKMNQISKTTVAVYSKTYKQFYTCLVHAIHPIISTMSTKRDCNNINQEGLL